MKPDEMMVVNVASQKYGLALDDDHVGGTRTLSEVESIHRRHGREEKEEKRERNGVKNHSYGGQGKVDKAMKGVRLFSFPIYYPNVKLTQIHILLRRFKIYQKSRWE